MDHHELEELRLAPYAVFSSRSRGRRHPEPAGDPRPAFQRDRDRIIHCAAFRRLEYKTQVFVNHEGDYYRTRLTHSLEVAQIARSLARRLRLNEDLVETLALAHDLGHTPFGHTGEQVLNGLMASEGGFEHNRQSLRIVEELEERYPQFDGLNLTWETREGIIKHSPEPPSDTDPTLAEYQPELHPPLEAQLIDLADEIAYNNHDIDDGLKSGHLTLQDLGETELWAETFEGVQRQFPEIKEDRRIYQTISRLIGQLIRDVTEQTEAEIARAGVSTLNQVRQQPDRLVSFSEETLRKNGQLKRLLFVKLYRHFKVERMRIKAEHILTRLFETYLKTPTLLPYGHQKKFDRYGHKRVICDYIAGMTDRYALQEFRRLFEP